MKNKLSRDRKLQIILVIAAVGLVYQLAFYDNTGQVKDSEQLVEDNGIVGLQEGTIQSGDEDYMNLIQKSLDEQVEEGMAKVFMNTDLTIKNGKIDLLMQNASDNTLSQQIEITDKKGDTVYKSAIVKPGSKIEYDKVSKALKKGKHTCKVMLYMLDPSTNEVVTQVGLPEIEIKVE